MSIKEVSKSEPCRHCGKDNWCYRTEDGLIEVCKRDAEPADGWYKTGKQDKEGSSYYAPEVVKKQAPTKKTETDYFYTYWNNTQIVKVVRIDDGKGKKTFNQYTKQGSGWKVGFSADREKLALYRWAEVEQAIADGRQIFVVEGEGVADALWEIGIAATTNIGGSKKWRAYGDYSGHLKDADIVICPDRDEPGIKHAEDVAQDFPNAKWCYASPNEFMWKHLPKSKGIDLGDWIAAGATKKMILEAVRDKWDLTVAEPKKEVDLSQVVEDVKNKIATTEVEKELKTVEIAKKHDAKYSEVRAFEKAVEKDADAAYAQQEIKEEIAEIFANRAKKLDVRDYLDSELADEIEITAKEMGVPASAILHCLLPTASTLLHPASRITVRKSINFKQPFVLFNGIIAESGTRKTPLVDMVTSPLKDLQRVEDEKYELEKAEYELAWKAWKADKNKDINNEPQPPAPPREYHLLDVTTEAIAKIICQQSKKGVLYLKDELSGFFRSQNAYRSGKGADREFFLELYNGNGVKRNRMEERASSRFSGLSLLGGIQPAALKKLMGDMKDEQGEWARFLFFNLPTERHSLPRGEDSDKGFRLSYLLRDLYEQIDQMPEQQLTLSTEAYNCFADYYDLLDAKRHKENRQGVRAALSKQVGATVRLAGILHLINGIREGDVAEKISLQTMESAIKLSTFYIAQIELVYGENLGGHEQVSEFTLMLDAAKRNNGVLKPRDLTRGLFRGMKASEAKQKLEALAKAGYGVINKSGSSIVFTLSSEPANEELFESNNTTTEPVDTSPGVEISTTEHNRQEPITSQIQETDNPQPKKILDVEITHNLNVGDEVVMFDSNGKNPAEGKVLVKDGQGYLINIRGGEERFDYFDIQIMLNEQLIIIQE